MSPDELKQQIRQITVWKRGEQAAKGSGHGKRTLAGDCAEVVVWGRKNSSLLAVVSDQKGERLGVSPPMVILPQFSVFGVRCPGSLKGQDPVGGATGVRYTRRSVDGHLAGHRHVWRAMAPSA